MPMPMPADVPPAATPPASARRRHLARALSVIGHPALLMPLAVVGGAAGRGAPGWVVASGLGVSAGLALAVMGFGAWRVRAGRWGHVDASQPAERRDLQRFLVAVLALGALATAATGLPRAVPLGLGAGLAVVVAGVMLRRWLKLSLHAGFAVLAAALCGPDRAAGLALLALAGAVGWSRCVLGRHAPRDVLAGWLCGALAGAAFHALAR